MTLNFVRENLTHNLLITIHSHVLLTMEMHSEKCVSRQCHHGVNIVGYIYIEEDSYNLSLMEPPLYM